MTLRTGRRTAVTTFISLLLASASCGHSSEPSRECSENVTVIVSAAPTPVFSWTPACTLGSIMVERIEPSGGRVLLWLTTDQRNEISPGVEYGSRGGPAPLLQAGLSYRVTIGVIIGGDAIFTLDTRNFSR